MAIIQTGSGGSTLLTVDTNTKALRSSNRPLDADGAFRYAGFTGILAAATTGEIFQFRWTGAGSLAIINKIVISGAVSTTFFAAGVPLQLNLFKSTGWTVAGTGGTGITPAALLRKRSSLANTLVAAGDMRIATTAALGAGTKTLETLSMSSIAAACPITASLNGLILPPGTVFMENDVGGGMYPLVLDTNEGVSISIGAVPATGTWTAGIIIDWSEVAAY